MLNLRCSAQLDEEGNNMCHVDCDLPPWGAVVVFLALAASLSAISAAILPGLT